MLITIGGFDFVGSVESVYLRGNEKERGKYMGLVMCPKCGFKVSDEDSTCFVCGSVLKKDKIEAQAAKKIIISENNAETADKTSKDRLSDGSMKAGSADKTLSDKKESARFETRHRVSDETSEIGRVFGTIERETVKPVYKSIDESV